MRVLLICTLVVFAASAVAQDTSRIGAGIYANPSGFFAVYAAPFRQADVLIGDDTAGGTFPDLTDEYEAAFLNAGVSDTEIIHAPSMGPIPFPDPLDADDYPIVVVLTADNWWSAPDNFQTEDANALIDYMDTGGNLLIVGQDLLWGYKPGWGSPNDGLFDDYMGVSSVTQDVLYDDASSTWTGYGPLDGLSGTGTAATVFTANGFFCDDLNEGDDAEIAITGEPDHSYTYAVACDTGSTRALFSTFELASDSSNFDDIIQAIYDWFGGGVPDEEDPIITDMYPQDADWPSGIPPTENVAGCHWQDGDPDENSGIDTDESTFEVFDSGDNPVSGELTIDDADEYDVIVDFEADELWLEGETYTVETTAFDNAGNSADETWDFTTGYTNIVEKSFGAIKADFR
jgi:hypothetical protein